jgi:hypothetical protein
MKNTITILLLTLLASCVNQKKVGRWLDEHETEAAKYCADKFPAETISTEVIKYVDSSGYSEAYGGLQTYADSLLDELSIKTRNATPDRPYKPNIDSIRKAVDIEIRKKLKPCIDSVKEITKVIVDKARERYLQGLIDQKDNTITKKDAQNATLQDKLAGARKWKWYFFILLLIIGGYVAGRIKKVIP